MAFRPIPQEASLAPSAEIGAPGTSLAFYKLPSSDVGASLAPCACTHETHACLRLRGAIQVDSGGKASIDVERYYNSPLGPLCDLCTKEVARTLSAA